jgi:hypothetical protein
MKVSVPELCCPRQGVGGRRFRGSLREHGDDLLQREITAPDGIFSSLSTKAPSAEMPKIEITGMGQFRLTATGTAAW